MTIQPVFLTVVAVLNLIFFFGMNCLDTWHWWYWHNLWYFMDLERWIVFYEHNFDIICSV